MPTEDHPNCEQIRDVFASFNNSAEPGEASTVLESAFAEDAVWHHLGGDSPHAGRYDGRDAIINLMGNMFNDSGGTWRPTAVDVRAVGNELVLVDMTEHAEIDGTPHEGHVAVIFRVNDGKITEGIRMMERELDAHWGKAAAPVI